MQFIVVGTVVLFVASGLIPRLFSLACKLFREPGSDATILHYACIILHFKLLCIAMLLCVSYNYNNNIRGPVFIVLRFIVSAHIL